MSVGTESFFFAIFIVLAAMVVWTAVQLRVLYQRVAALEKQHLALVAELEDRIFGGQGGD